MSRDYALAHLKREWSDYLEKHGHHIYSTPGEVGIIQSRNSKKARYRRLLLISRRPVCGLGISRQAHIRRHLEKAKAQREAAYLVVGFVAEPGRIVILPAETALKDGRIRSDKGGIAWED